MSSPFTLRWGIMGLGDIARTFTKDLLIDPSTRDATDVKHVVAAAASSTSLQKARKFIEDCKCPTATVAYDAYNSLVQDKDVDVVYIATPHSHHYQNAMLCLNAGKHVLCEKAFTVNAPQAEILAKTAKEKHLFLMEAVWTRFFPLTHAITKTIMDGTIGPIHRVIADMSFGEDVENVWGTTNRMVNLDLAGGALLDLGIYSLTWLFQCIYHLVPPPERKPPTVTSIITKYPPTGADEMTSMLLSFPSAPNGGGGGTNHPAHGIALTNIRVADDPDGHGSAGPTVHIQGSKGEIAVNGPAYSPTTFRIIMKGGNGSQPADVKEHEFLRPGWGMFWEADECARCVRDGKGESEVLGLEESVVIMRVMDEVRRQNGLVYPAKIESTEYPLEL
ncbi:MAG: hypothetical protein Q9172_005798 [Xanthocarpia lactea]